jgi:hypothetical protein
MEPVIAAASPLAPALVRLPALPTRAALNRNGDGSTLYIGVSDYAVYAAPTLRRPNITPPQVLLSLSRTAQARALVR